jgi:hypothetical protein
LSVAVAPKPSAMVKADAGLAAVLRMGGRACW